MKPGIPSPKKLPSACSMFSCFVGVILLVSASHVVLVSAQTQTGTVVGKVYKKKQKPEDPDVPLPEAKVQVEDGTDDEGKTKLKVVKPGTEQDGGYEFNYAQGVQTVVISKRPYWKFGSRTVDVPAGKKTASETTYLERDEPSSAKAFGALNFLNAGDTAKSETLLKSLVASCVTYEHRECDLVREAQSALLDLDASLAKVRLKELSELLALPIAPFGFRKAQSMYIVAFRPRQPLDSTTGNTNRRDYLDNALDVERKVRKGIEKWNFFKVVDKSNAADFIFLVNLDDSSIEGLAIPLDAYRQHFKDRFDLDALRDAAYGRYLVGPLKLATLTRLSDRLVKQFRERVPGS